MTLHLVNGEATAERLRASGLPGEIHSIDDILMEGPVPGGLATRADWDERARELERRFGIEAADYLAGLDERDQRLAAACSAARFDEAVLWFEEDLFCQINLVCLLSRLPTPTPAALRLICPPTGRLGRLPPAELAALYPGRTPISEARVALARRVWQAYAAAEPRDLVALLDADFSAWPLLHSGLRHHLSRLPGPRGLDALEEILLGALADRAHTFGELLSLASSHEALAPLGLGDGQLAERLRGLSPSLVTLLATPAATQLAPACLVTITKIGEAVHRGEIDRLAVQPIDRWVGGVLLQGKDVWRWDGAALSR